MEFSYDDYLTSARALQQRLGQFVPQVAMILGSGLGELGDQVESPV